MAEENRDPELQQPNAMLPPRMRKWWGLISACIDSACDTSLSPLNNYLRSEWPHLLNVLDVLIFFVLLGGLGGYILRGYGVNAKYSFLKGESVEKDRQISRIESELAKVRQDDNQQLTQLKIDSNETKREKDAEISKIMSEKNSIQQQLSMFESSPAELLRIYSNLFTLYSNEPTNREQFATLFSRVESLTTNVLSEIQLGRPSFIVYANGIEITNEATIPIAASRELLLAVQNSSEISAQRVTISAIVATGGTNVNSAGWDSGPPPVVVMQRKWIKLPNTSQLTVENQKILPSSAFFGAPPLVFSTNIPASSLGMILSVYAERTKGRSLNITLVF